MAAKKKTAKKKAAKKTGKTPAARKTPDPKSGESGGSEQSKASKDAVSSLSVNLGHVFALRPRVSTTFRQPDFLTARHMLQDESYGSIPEAARAVAEKALELTHDGPPGRRERR
ncbi:MAG: hypothetical protein VCB42_01970 [Myxococcota bacterium]